MIRRSNKRNTSWWNWFREYNFHTTVVFKIWSTFKNQKAHISLLSMCFYLSSLQTKFLFFSGNYIFCCFVIWCLTEKFHAQIIVELGKCCIHVKNVVVFVVFVDFVVFVVVKHFSLVFSLVFSLNFSLDFLGTSLRWNSKYSRSNLRFLTSCYPRVFNVWCKTNERESSLFAKLIFHKSHGFRKYQIKPHVW